MTASVKGGAVMGSKHAEAEQRERQARIEQDIRQLFARYRQTGRNSEAAQRPQKARPARRFARAPGRAAPRAG
jgi:hypothetical protein